MKRKVGRYTTAYVDKFITIILGKHDADKALLRFLFGIPYVKDRTINLLQTSSWNLPHKPLI